MTGTLVLRRMMGRQLWLRSFTKLLTHQIAGSTSAKHCLLSELRFPEISWVCCAGWWLRSSECTKHLWGQTPSAAASSTGGTRTRTKVCEGHGALCSDKELPSEPAQVLQSLQQLCRHGQAAAPIWCSIKAVLCQDSICFVLLGTQVPS